VAQDEGDFFALKIVHQYAVALAGLTKGIGGVLGVVKWAGHGSGREDAGEWEEDKKIAR
jgi:hypothetical protein